MARDAGSRVDQGLGRRVSRHRRYGAGCALRREPGPSSRCVASGETAHDLASARANNPGAVLSRQTEVNRKDCRERPINQRITCIASTPFREVVRDRVLYNLIAFALLFSGAAMLVRHISIDIEKLVVINL